MSTFSGQFDAQNEKRSFLKNIWPRYGEKIILLFGIVLIAAISFEAGLLKGKNNQNAPVTVSQTACAPCSENEDKKTAESAPDNVQPNNSSKEDALPSAENKKCAFVASKNSNKFHLPSCAYAQKIKPENRVCFSSKEEAQSRGYQSAKCCIK